MKILAYMVHGVRFMGVCVVAIAFATPDLLLAQPAAARAATLAAPKIEQEPQNPKFLRVVIKTSRPEVAVENTYGVYADLQNLASIPLTLYRKDTRLVVQPEVTKKGMCVYSLYAFLPTESGTSFESEKIRIRPNEHYTIFWEVSGRTTVCDGTPTQSTWRESLVNQMNFAPGDYIFTVEGKVHFSPDEQEEAHYHTFSESAPLHVGISQIDTIWAAVFGGFLAYLVTFVRSGGALRRSSRATGLKKWISVGFLLARNIASAMLLSGVITIVLSRVSETNFPIKVSVADFWGALTIGFIAYFVGNRVIDGLVNWASAALKSNGRKPEEPETPPQAQGPKLQQQPEA